MKLYCDFCCTTASESSLKVKDTLQCRENPVTDLHRHHDNNNCCVSSGQLLLSVRSFCGRCCREVVDVALVTEHLQACGVKVSQQQSWPFKNHLLLSAQTSCLQLLANIKQTILWRRISHYLFSQRQSNMTKVQTNNLFRAPVFNQISFLH